MAGKSIRPEKVLRIIGLSLFGVAILLAFVGCFGDIVKQVYSVTQGSLTQTTVTTTPFTWIFKDMWKNLDSVKTYPQYPYQLLFSILTLITFIGCISGVISIFIVCLVKFVGKTGIEGVNVNKCSKLLAVSVLPFLITIMMFRYGGMVSEQRSTYNPIQSTTLNTTYGWGTMLIVVGLILGVVASAFSSIKDNMNKNAIVHNILTKISMVLLAFVVIFGFRGFVSQVSQRSSLDYVYYSEAKASIFSLLASCSIYNPETQTYSAIPGATTLAIFAMIFIFAMACFVILFFNAKKVSAKITFLACLFGCSIISGILSKSALNQILEAEKIVETTSKFGSALIVTAVLSGIALIITCVSAKFATPETKQVTKK